jgi:hypothetical protein
MAVYFDFKTKNKSFIYMHNVLKGLGVKNNKFMLQLYNKELEGVDILDPNLPVQYQALALDELRRGNIMFFLREMCVVPTNIGPTRYRLNPGNLAASYLMSMNIHYYWEQPRQTGKTLSQMGQSAPYFLYILNYSLMMLFNYSDPMVKENMDRLMTIMSYLPKWAQLHSISVKDIDDDIVVKEKKDITSVPKEYSNDVLKNRLRPKTIGNSRAQAGSAGRGATAPFANIDEFGWCKFNWMAWGSLSPALKTAQDNAKSIGAPYHTSFTSTPPDMSTPEGEWLYKYIFDKGCVKFHHTMYDYSEELIRSIMRKHGSRNFMLISYKYNELGLKESWLAEQRRDMATDTDFMRDVLLMWLVLLNKNPYGEVAVRKILDITSRVEYDTIVDGGYMWKVFKQFNEARLNTTILVSVDVSVGMGGEYDSSSITLIDSRNGRIVGVFCSNEVDPIALGDILKRFCLNYLMRFLIVIERTGIGVSTILYLVKIHMAQYLYASAASESHELNKAKADLVRGGKKFLYGARTTPVTRKEYFSILKTVIDNHKKLIQCEDLAKEISTLEDHNGKIEAKIGYHDDRVLSYLIGLRVLLNDFDIMTLYGIPNTSLEPDNADSENSDILEANIYMDKSNVVNLQLYNDDYNDKYKFKTIQDTIVEHDLQVFRAENNIDVDSLEDTTNPLQSNRVTLRGMDDIFGR